MKKEESMKETIINAKYYIEAGAFTCKGLSRYVLSAVRIEPHPKGGAVIVATDGHTMGIFHDADGKCDEAVTVSYRPEIARLAKARKGIKRIMRVNGEVDLLDRGKDDKLLVRFFGAIEINANFPDWQRVLPKESEAKNLADFNGEFLHRCATAKKEFRSEGITIFQKDRETQAIIRNQRPDFVGIVMPIRGGQTEPYPTYLQSLLPTEKAKK